MSDIVEASGRASGLVLVASGLVLGGALFVLGAALQRASEHVDEATLALEQDLHASLRRFPRAAP